VERLLLALTKQRVLVLVFFTLCIIGGLVAFQSVPIDAFPDLTNNQVQVLTETVGMAPVETEELVTIPIEALMNGLPRVQQVRSISKFGLSVVTIVFEDGVDTYFARQLVNERVQTARSRLPSGIAPELGPISTGMGELYQYVVEGKGYSPMQLKTLHDWDIKYQLRTVPGVNEVNTWGGFTQEYTVTIAPEKLLQYHLTVKDLFDALANNNANFSGGLIEHNDQQYIVRGLGRVNSLADIGNIIVKQTGRTPILVSTIADVSLGTALRQGAVTKDGQGEVVTGMVMMLKGENSRNVINRVKEKIEGLHHSLPQGVEIKPFYDQTHLVEQTLHTVQSNLVEGGLLVITILLLMLGNLRAALIVAVTIPLSLMFSFMGMKALGITANIMSLGALDFGMIVDGAIVMVENTLRKLAHPPKNAPADIEPCKRSSQRIIINQSLQEMAKPILFGVLIIAVVYMPILALEGMEYKLFSPMVFTVIFALLGSLLVALLLVPVLCSFFLRGNIVEKPNKLVESVRKPYQQLLNWAFAHQKKTLLTASLIFILSMASIPFLGTEFVPKLDEGDFIVNSIGLPSVSLGQTAKTTTQIEQLLLQYPEVKTAVSKIGRPDLATDPMSPNAADTYVTLNPPSQWRAGVTKASLLAGIRQALPEAVLGVDFNLTQPVEMRVNELVSGIRADLAIKLFGDDMEILIAKAGEIERVMQTIEGQADLQTEKLSGSGQLLITPDRVKMSRYGVTMADIRTLVETAITGTPVSEVLKGKQRFALRVKFPQGNQVSPDRVGQFLIETTTGQRISLNQVASIEVGESVEVVNRELGQRRIIIQMNVKNRDVGSFVAEGKRKIAEQVVLPAGYTLDWGGQFENQQRAMGKLALAIPLAILVIFGLLMATFSKLKHALLVILNVPFALIGGVMGLWVGGLYLSVPALVGFIALFGVAILNGLVLVSTINSLRETEGLPLEVAIAQGAETRLRPVLMTALVAGLGFMPMALSTGSGAEVQKPLAIVVIGGLITSTVLTLVLLPVLYRWISLTEETDS
jgi:cobalt-zinc-cadmium resistance protein CzcA